MLEDRRPLSRDLGLIVVAFVATLILLVGLFFALNSRPPIDAGAGPTATASTPTSAEPSGSAPSGSHTGDPSPSDTGDPTLSASPPSDDDPVIVAAGDIAYCNQDGDEATANLLDDIPGTVIALGDNAYGSGTVRQYDECYDPTWGRHKDRTRAVPGNHDYDTTDAGPYKDYFAESSLGPDGETWYSFDLGTWHVVALDSNCGHVDCDETSDQVRWLVDDLAASDARCTLAMWHHARFSSGFHGNDRDVAPFWDALHDAGADVVLNGHDHDYERFAPQNPDAEEDREAGIRQFVVGTGGSPLREFEETAANSELRASISHGVLTMTLRDGTYEWEFIPTDGPFSDRGSATCH
jgi:hypothetical protein